MLEKVGGLVGQEHPAKTIAAVIAEDQSRSQCVATPDTVQADTTGRSGHQHHINSKGR